MAGFLYFLPHATSGAVKPEYAAACGLDYVFRDGQACIGRVVANGPEGSSGVMCGAHPHAGLLAYDAQVQRWQRISDSVYLGWYTDHRRPTPADLAYTDQLAGEHVRLGDGHDWLIPHARCWREFHGDGIWQDQLPRVLQWDGTRFAPGDVRERYRELWRLLGAYEDAWTAAVVQAYGDRQPDEPVQFAFGDYERLCCLAIAANYRVSEWEISALELLDTSRGCSEIIAALEDIATWQTWLQKKSDAAAAGEPSSDGPTPPTTDRSTPTSQP